MVQLTVLSALLNHINRPFESPPEGGNYGLPIPDLPSRADGEGLKPNRLARCRATLLTRVQADEVRPPGPWIAIRANARTESLTLWQPDKRMKADGDIYDMA